MSAGLADLPLGIGGLGEGNADWIVLSHEAACGHKLICHGLVGVVLVDSHSPELLVHRVQLLLLSGAQGVSHVVQRTVHGELEVGGCEESK